MSNQEQAQADIKRLAVRHDGEEVAERMSTGQFTKQVRETIR
ncbi:MAG: hypothetical protein U0841_12950 [Chloroflexia bacterium]